MKLLNAEEIKDSLTKVNNWFFINNSIEKEFKLKSFSDALAFLIKVGIEAEKLDHHPSMLLHSWNKVKISLTTHDVTGITENDFKLAQTIDTIRQ